MTKRHQERLILIMMVIATLAMTILRFLLNEKGRVSPDSIRFLRQARIFPEIDNTTAPLGYPLGIKLFTFIGFDEFWSSKILGIFCYLFIIYFAYKKKFYLKEIILICALFSYVSIFSYTMSEAFILPIVIVYIYVTRNIILGLYKKFAGIFYLSLLLILLYNIRYSALFFMGGSFVFGLLTYHKNYGKIFIISGIIGLCFVVFYKFSFIDYFNEDYIGDQLRIGMHPTSKLLLEFFQGLTTSFNPFIHIVNPKGGIINYGIYGIGFFNITLMVFLFVKNGLSETEKFLVFIGFFGIICSYFIQYFYLVNAIDYRLLSPFIFPIWMVYFKKLFQLFGKKTYNIAFLSFWTGSIFIWLSKGNYLENRKNMTQFLKNENLKNVPIKFYATDSTNINITQIPELISTINPQISITKNAKDTLQNTTLTGYKVLRKIKIDENQFQ